MVTKKQCFSVTVGQLPKQTSSQHLWKEHAQNMCKLKADNMLAWNKGGQHETLPLETE